MQFTLTFQFPIYNSVPNLERHLEKINAFLKNHVNPYRDQLLFSIKLYPADFQFDSYHVKSVRKYATSPEHKGHHLLGFFFFNARQEIIGNLTLLLDLGETLEDESTLKKDVCAVSAIAATQLDLVTFNSRENNLEVSLLLDDTSPMYGFLSKHLHYVINELPIEE